MTVFAVIGATSLALLFGWLGACIIASDLSDRKGYGERPGLASGLLASAVGVIAWLAIRPKAGSLWSRYVRVPDLVTAAAALVLLISLFLNWYSDGISFINDMKFYDLLLLAAVAIGYGQLHSRASGRAPDGLDRAVLAAGALATLLALVALATPPDGASLEIGAFLGLIASVVMLAGAVLAARVDRDDEQGAATVAEARSAGVEAS